MKKLFKGLIIVILMGAAASTIGRFTGINLDYLYRAGMLMYILYFALSECNSKRELSR